MVRQVLELLLLWPQGGGEGGGGGCYTGQVQIKERKRIREVRFHWKYYSVADLETGERTDRTIRSKQRERSMQLKLVIKEEEEAQIKQIPAVLVPWLLIRNSLMETWAVLHLRPAFENKNPSVRPSQITHDLTDDL